MNHTGISKKIKLVASITIYILLNSNKLVSYDH